MQYKPRLDGLRFLAIMMVLLEHFVYFIGSKVSGGFYGVNLFFVLSGYLITSILLADNDKTFKEAYTRFLGRRILRIFPIYYLVILFLFLISANGIRENFAYLLTYTYNFKLGQTNNWHTLYSAYWSLSVEEQFYVFFPIVVILCKRHPRFLGGVFISIVLIGYAQMLFNIFDIKKYNYVGLLTNMSFLALGAMGALATKENVLPKKLFTSLYIEIFLLIVLFVSLTSQSWEIRQLLLPFLNLYLVIKAASFSFKIPFFDRLFMNKRVIYIGRISYGIYLYHGVVFYFFTTYLFDPVWSEIPFNNLGWLSKIQFNAWIIKFPAVSLLTIVIAGLSYIYIEHPILRLKNKYFKYKAEDGSEEGRLEPAVA